MDTVRIVRVAILGAESTGKSTLAAALAGRYRTLWVPEYLREFVETRRRTPHENEQLVIATTQVEREATAARLARRVLFCDTTPLMTAIYSRFYWGRVDPRLDALARNSTYDFTIVTAPDGPWIADGLQRESEAVRQTIHENLLATLEGLAIPFLLVAGGLEQRLRQVDALLRIRAQALATPALVRNRTAPKP
jgi:NadR type nicotinamide-nucleotide adenylyltransferase